MVGIEAADMVVVGIERLLTMVASDWGGVLGVVEGAAVAIRDGRIAWVGTSDQAPSSPIIIDGAGCVGVPGLVDCHTHAVWAGSRAGEWRARLSGASYAEILESGGGIHATVRATRAATDRALVDGCAARLSAALDRGITTIEVKSGYGLTAHDERRCLVAARRAGQQVGVRVLTTFLGAHTVPAEHRATREAYVRSILQEQLPAVREVADFADAFIDRGAFTLDEGARVLRAAAAAGLGIKVHAEQLSVTGAAALAAELGAVSVDHLERMPPEVASELARAGTVAVLLPGACLYLGDPSPPIQALRAAGVPMAVATDLNPGSSPIGDLWACATLSCVLMRLTIEEALLGITRNAALALGRPDLGVVRVGAPADLVLMAPPAGEPAHEDALVQRLDGHRAELVVVGGRVARDRSGRAASAQKLR